MQHTTMFLEIDLQSNVDPFEQRAAAFAALRQMLRMFRKEPFTTDGSHEEIYITDVRQIDPKREAPD